VQDRVAATTRQMTRFLTYPYLFTGGSANLPGGKLGPTRTANRPLARTLIEQGSPIGREGEIAIIDDFVLRSRENGDALFVVGEPGVGKTLLLGYAAKRASASGMRVLVARGVEFEAEMSFSGLHQALFPLVGEFAGLSTVHSDALSVALGVSGGPPPTSLVLSNAVLAALRLAASRQPVLLVVDDVPWVDRASTVALGFVARRLAGSHVGLLASARTGHESFFNHAGITDLELLPLDDTGAEELVSERFPELAENVRVRVLDEAQGNPLALLELPRSLSEEQRSARKALPSSLPQSRRVQGLFAERLEGLPQATRLLLLLIALDGTGDLRAVEAPDGDGPTIGDLLPAEELQLVHVDRDTHQLTFRHPLMRSAVVEVSTASQRRWAHMQLVQRRSDSPELQAWHLSEAAMGHDELAAGKLEWLAEQKLRRGDAVGAVTALTRSAELSPLTIDRGRRFAEAAFIGADIAGALQDASRLLTAARHADPKLGETLQAAITAALIWFGVEGEVNAAHTMLVGAIESWVDAGGGSTDLLAEALGALMTMAHYGGRPELWEPFERLLTYFKGAAPSWFLVSLATLGDPVRTGRDVLQDLDRMVDAINDEETIDPSVTIRICNAGYYVDRYPSRTSLLNARQEAASRGMVRAEVAALTMLCDEALRSGQWADAREYGDQAAAMCALHNTALYSWPARYNQALLSSAIGDFDTARAIADAIMQWAVPRGLVARQWFAWQIRTLVALGEGDYESAFRYASSISPPGQLPSHVCFALKIPMDLVEAAERTGRHDEAVRHVAALRAAEVAQLSPRLAMLVTASEAIVAPPAEADALYCEALKVPGADAWSFEYARVQLLHGEQLRRVRNMTDARAELLSASETFERIGAKPWASRAHLELNATAQTRIRSRESVWSSLTPQQRQIASLAASGLTNKQIADRLYLSHRTVSGHLHKVFPILGISTRAALRDALADLPNLE
jgi:DNA-binding CsgD family transcriptional regulator